MKDLHIHLDPIGGLAGDMFIAAVLDAFPELRATLDRTLRAAGLNQMVRLAHSRDVDHGIAGSRLSVVKLRHDESKHRTFGNIKTFLQAATLDPNVCSRAIDIFSDLADAEAKIHGVTPEDVTFHEVGAWDSLADVLGAASLIDALEASSWSCSPLPMGNGVIESDHGQLPIPAPAVVALIEGYPVRYDQFDGERVTPTGAAILRHLAPDFPAPAGSLRLLCHGHGLGQNSLPGLCNLLRLIAYERDAAQEIVNEIVVCRFEIDDQNPEDLAIALDRLRSAPGVVDVIQSPAVGKKGRLISQIQVLCEPRECEAVFDACFNETTTLGLRWQRVDRRILQRRSVTVKTGDHSLRVKRAQRPNGNWTAKAEMDDIAHDAGNCHDRSRLRHSAEQLSELEDSCHVDSGDK